MKTWILLCGYCSKSKALAKYVLYSLALLVASLGNAQPSELNKDAILDEAFLLFLADSIENDTELLDPLSMLENQDSQTDTTIKTQADNKEANDE